MIKDLVSPELLRNVRSEIQRNLSFTLKETDIYKIYQSGDLANLDGLDDPSLELLPSLLKLRNALYSPAFRDYLSTITGSGPLSGTKTDMAINIYTPGCHLLCHDDVIGSRRVSYILYITDPDEPWKKEWGGALRLYPTVTHTADDGKIVKVPSPDHDVFIPPAFNQFSFFAVQPGESFHDVEEVYASPGGEEDEVRVRIAISGWYHIPQDGEAGFVLGLEKKLAEKSSLMQLQGKVDIFDLPKMNFQSPNLNLDSSFGTTDNAKTTVLHEDQVLSEEDLNFLVKYISPVYLTPDTLNSVADIFGEQFSLTLDTFLAPKFSKSLREFIAIQESQPLATKTSEIEKTTPWTVARPPHKHRFLFQQKRETRIDSTNQSPLQDLLENLLPSRPFYKWLQLATGQTLSSHNLLARRFRRGKDYTLATGYDEADFRLEITLAITPSTGWEPDAGLEDQPDDNSETKYEEVDETDEKPVERVEEKTGDVPEKKPGDSPEEKTGDSPQQQTGGSSQEKTGDNLQEKTGEGPEDKTSETGGDRNENTGDSPKENTSGRSGDKIDHDAEDKTEVDEHADDKTSGSSEEKLDEDVEDKTKLDIHADVKSGASREGSTDGSGEEMAGEEKLDGGKTSTFNDVGGYLMYMADDDIGNEGPDMEGQSPEMTGARASSFSKSKDNSQVKPDPAIYQSSGRGDGDEALFTMPAGWNQLGIVLRDKGVLRFVKYVSQQAEGDRWDICGEYNVVEEEDEGVDVQNKVGETEQKMYNTTEEEKEDEETETSDEY